METIKKNNKGISLIEIVVTVSVIAIVVIPLISGFFTAMEINSDSRRIQNATNIAQDVMEIVKAKDIDALLEYSMTNYEVTGVGELTLDNKGREYPKYTFTDWKVTGADTEDFYVDIVLDSSTYAALDGATSTKVPVNSMSKPEFSSLFGSDVIMLFKQYTSVDNQLESHFRAARVLTETEIQNMKDNPGLISKSTNMLIICNYTGTLYNYTISLEMTYTYNNDPDKYVTVAKTISKTYDTPDGHAIYFMMTPFDTYTTSEGATSEGYYCTDKLNISYMYSGEAASKPDVGLFLTEQAVKHKHNPAMNALIDSKNITYENSTNIYSYNNATRNLKIYTNIEKSYSDTGSSDNLFGLTDSDKLDSSLLYDVTINVKYEGEVIATFSGSKED